MGGLTVGALRGSLQFVPRRDVVAYACDSRGADALVTTYPTRLILTVAACAVEIVRSARRAGVPGKRVLDLASGPTAVSRLLLDAGAREVVALERDPAMLAAASCLPAPGLGELHVVRADAHVCCRALCSLDPGRRRVPRPLRRLFRAQTPPRVVARPVTSPQWLALALAVGGVPAIVVQCLVYPCQTSRSALSAASWVVPQDRWVW